MIDGKLKISTIFVLEIRGKISKTVERDLRFIFDELSEFVVIFVSNLIFSAAKNVVSFT